MPSNDQYSNSPDGYRFGKSDNMEIYKIIIIGVILACLFGLGAFTGASMANSVQSIEADCEDSIVNIQESLNRCLDELDNCYLGIVNSGDRVILLT